MQINITHTLVTYTFIWAINTHNLLLLLFLNYNCERLQVALFPTTLDHFSDTWINVSPLNLTVKGQFLIFSVLLFSFFFFTKCTNVKNSHRHTRRWRTNRYLYTYMGKWPKWSWHKEKITSYFKNQWKSSQLLWKNAGNVTWHWFLLTNPDFNSLSSEISTFSFLTLRCVVTNFYSKCF